MAINKKISKYSLEELQNLKYKKNFLEEVIFRIDFSPILIISSKQPSLFQDKIRVDFPGFKKNTIIELTTTFKDALRQDEQRTMPEWNFRNKEGDSVIKLNQNVLVMVVNRYSNFENYKSSIINVFNSFEQTYKNININRFGLRYKNIIKLKDGNPVEWNKLINETLIKQLDSKFIGKDEISRAMSQIGLNKDDCNVIINYGIWNKEYPAKVSRKEYILDYDCYTTNCEELNVEETLITFNTEIKKLFEYSIKDKLREIMEVI